jgi:hypothetical protein
LNQLPRILKPCSHKAHSNIFTAAAQKRDLHWGAEPGIEPGPSVQQADALRFELRRTLFELCRTLFELRRTLFELRRTLFELRRTLFELRRTLFELRRTLFELCRTLMSSDAP